MNRIAKTNINDLLDWMVQGKKDDNEIRQILEHDEYMAWAVIDSFSPNAAGGKYLTPEYIDAYYKLQDLARKPAERYRREQKKMSFPHRSGDERSQLWEPCERCGNEPSYATFHGHLCEKCMKKVGMRVSMADSANRIAVARELVKLARELVGTEPVRIFYIGGGTSTVSGITENLAKEFEAAFPRSTKKKRRDGNAFTYYVAEKMEKKIEAWLKSKGVKVGGSPMWELQPGEMPSW